MKKKNKTVEKSVWVVSTTEDTSKFWVSQYSNEYRNVVFASVQYC